MGRFRRLIGKSNLRIVARFSITVIALGCAMIGASQAPDLVERARAAYPPLSDAGPPSLTLLHGADTSALGCELLAGLPLPDPLDVYRLEFPLEGMAFAVHVSADGALTQACDERLPNLGAGTQLVARADADSDGDGRPDEQDDCPYIAGSAAGGCPLPTPSDSDGDGVPDNADHCAAQAGAAAAEGCALLADSDGDGVPDHIDICRADFGPYHPDIALGCPADGSGTSTQRRSAADTCLAAGADRPLRASGDAASAVIGSLADTPERSVIGRGAAGDWLQLAAGWIPGEGARLTGACFNIPLVNAAAGGATGCFLRPPGESVNVRQGPAGAVVARLASETPQAVLGRNFARDWLMVRAGWVSRAVVELAGSCQNLPVLDPALVSSGIIHFCPPGFRGFLPPRIGIGQGKARVVSQTIANRLRAQPSIDARQIGEIAPRRAVDAVLDGPACHGPWVWWQVEVAGLVGWTVESDVNYNYYYLEPLAEVAPVDAVRLEPLRATGQLIHSGNINSLNIVRLVNTKAPVDLAWSPQQTALATLSANGRIALDPTADLRDHEWPVNQAAASAIAFSPDERWLALGDEEGVASLLDQQSASPQGEARRIGQLDGPIHALAWSRAGDKLAAVGGAEALKLARGAGTLKLWTLDASAPENSKLVLNQRFPYPLTSLAFSANDRWLAVTGEASSAGRAALWVFAADTGELQLAKPLIPLDGHSSVVAAPARSLDDFVYSSGESLYQLDAASGVDQRFYHHAGALLREFTFRPQALVGAEALLALAVESSGGGWELQLTNALSPYGGSATYRLAPGGLAFSPDGRLLALTDRERDFVLVLGVTEG